MASLTLKLTKTFIDVEEPIDFEGTSPRARSLSPMRATQSGVLEELWRGKTPTLWSNIPSYGILKSSSCDSDKLVASEAGCNCQFPSEWEMIDGDFHKLADL